MRMSSRRSLPSSTPPLPRVNRPCSCRSGGRQGERHCISLRFRCRTSKRLMPLLVVLQLSERWRAAKERIDSRELISKRVWWPTRQSTLFQLWSAPPQMQLIQCAAVLAVLAGGGGGAPAAAAPAHCCSCNGCCAVLVAMANAMYLRSRT